MIYVECNPDEALVLELTGLPKREVRHKHGKSEVFSQLDRVTGSKGMVDEDPGSPPPPSLQGRNPSQHLEDDGLKVYDDSGRTNRVVVICPRLEEWILRAAAEAKLTVGDYGFPESANAFHRKISTENRATLDKFAELVGDLQGRRSRRIATLKRLLTEKS